MADYFVLSNFDTHYFLEDYTDSNTVPAEGTTELDGLIGVNIGGLSKDTKTYKTLNGNGWDDVAALGQSQDEATFDAVREGDGNAYDGTSGSATYNRVKNWVLNSVTQGGTTSPKCIVEVIPRGENVYEGTCYYVIPSKFTPGKKDTEGAQEYSFEVKPFGPQVPLTVTHTAAAGETPESWAFEKIA